MDSYPLPAFSAPHCRKATDGTTENELSVSGCDHMLFQGWLKDQDDSAICTYFTAVSRGLAEQQLQHYHFKIVNGRYNHRTQAQTPQWHCTVFYGEQDAAAGSNALRSGPLQVPRCMSCDLDCPLLLGITGEDPDTMATAASAAATATAAATPSLPAAEPTAEAPAAAAAAAGTPPQAAAATTAVEPAAAATAATTIQQAAADLEQSTAPADMSDPAPAQAVEAHANGYTAPADAAAGTTQQQERGQQQQQQQGDGQQQQGDGQKQQDDGQQQQQRQQQQRQQQQQTTMQIMRSRDTLVRESQHCRAWFDAKGRPMFVVTPKQHVETLAALSDAQLVDLFRTAVAVLEEMGCGCISMVLNRGDNRNHAHLHLKVKVHEREFERASQGWGVQHQQQLQAIRAFRDTLPPEHRGTHEAFMLRMRQAGGMGVAEVGGAQGVAGAVVAEGGGKRGVGGVVGGGEAGG